MDAMDDDSGMNQKKKTKYDNWKPPKQLEICCYSVESALLAERGGADSIELCDNYLQGGTTPSLGTIHLAAEKLSIPVNVMIRPRAGDFLYTDNEWESAERDVKAIITQNNRLAFQKMGPFVRGITFGALKANGQVDVDRTRRMVKLAKFGNLETTFHRAFDMCRDPWEALEDLKQCGVNRILTSGLRNTAMEGADLLRELVERAGYDIIIVPGSGVNEFNLQELVAKTNAWEFHSSARCFEKSKMQHIQGGNISMGGLVSSDEYQSISVDVGAVQRMKAILQRS